MKYELNYISSPIDVDGIAERRLKIKKKPVVPLGDIEKKYGPILVKYLKPFVITQLIAKGAMGDVFIACDRNDCLKVVKIQKLDHMKFFSNELKMQKHFYKLGLAPKIIKAFTFLNNKTEYSVVVMEKVDLTLGDLLKRNLDKEILDQIITMVYGIIDVLTKEKLIHGDLHWMNIGLVWDKHENHIMLKPLLLDFGWSWNDETNVLPELEITQLLRTLNRKYFPVNKQNEKVIESGLYKLLSTFQPKFPRNYDDYNSYYEQLLAHYIRNIRRG